SVAASSFVLDRRSAEKRCPGSNPAGHLLYAGAGVRGSTAVDLFPASGTSMRLVDATSRPEWPSGERTLGSYTDLGRSPSRTPQLSIDSRVQPKFRTAPLPGTSRAQPTLRYADAAPD